MGSGELNAGGNPAMDWHHIQRGVEILLVDSCYRNRDKLRTDGPPRLLCRLYLSIIHKLDKMILFYSISSLSKALPVFFSYSGYTSPEVAVSLVCVIVVIFYWY